MVPVGIRLELVGDAQAIDVAYRTTTGNLGYRGDGAGITFSVWRGGRKVCEEEALLGDGLIRLSLGTGAPDKPAIIYLPEGMHPVILSLTAVKGEISPAPELPRWIAYGDWTTQGWTASGPSQGWAAIAARKAGLDLVNFGYAGAGRGEIVSAEHIASLDADVISVAYGATCWTRVPYSVGMVAEGFRAFLDILRQGHPATPIVAISPIVRPDAEDVPNRLGATMADIRHAMETIARERILAGDTTLSLVAGETMITVDHLEDGIHPGDEGHKRIASAVTKALGAAMRSAGDDPPNGALIGNAILFGGQTGLMHKSAESSAAHETPDGGTESGAAETMDPPAVAEDAVAPSDEAAPVEDGGPEDGGASAEDDAAEESADGRSTDWAEGPSDGDAEWEDGTSQGGGGDPDEHSADAGGEVDGDDLDDADLDVAASSLG